MSLKIKILVAILAVGIVSGGAYYFIKSKPKATKQIEVNKPKEMSTGPANTGPVSPISGISCDNWNKRAVAVMQPSDVQARPAAGFSEADLVVEMPAYTGSVTRLMGVYLCKIPQDVGAIRSARHDYMALAEGLDAVFIHWGGSHFALDLLKQNVMDSMDCMTTNYCGRWPVSGIMRLEDTGHVTGENILKMIQDRKYRTEGKFQGYPHQEEATVDQRPNGGHLRVAFKEPYDANYDYDKATNSYLRTWNDTADTDRNNKQRLAPKNIVALFAFSDQITNTQDYVGKGLKDPWAGIEEVKNTGAESISGRYNNVQIGDPWYDSSDSGDAYYYMNGQEVKGTWKKDRSKLDSKLYFYDSNGDEIKFVPGQIWLEILEPGQNLRWTPTT
jgi:hypothetical protein